MSVTPVNSASIGVESLVMAVLTDEATNAYGAVTPVSPLINVKIAPKVNSDTLYADGVVVELISSLGEIDVEVEVQDLNLEVQAVMLGHTLDAVKGVMTYSAHDIAPYVALGFKIKKANGKFRYVWLLKGKFEEVDTEGKTQEDKVSFSTPKIKATFVARTDGNWKFVGDTDSGTTPVTASFLETVYPATV